MSYLLSSLLYKRRFFPYFSFSILAGLDELGTGAIYRYDAVGSFERVKTACVGKGEKLIQPMLDDLSKDEKDDLQLWDLPSSPITESSNGQLTLDSVLKNTNNYIQSLDTESAVTFIQKVFRAAAEREISIGDGIDVWILHYSSPNTEPDMKSSQSQENIDIIQQNEKLKINQEIAKSSTKRFVSIDRRYFTLPKH